MYIPKYLHICSGRYYMGGKGGLGSPACIVENTHSAYHMCNYKILNLAAMA